MRGYVTKKGKKYYAVIYDGIDPATGKEKRRWVAAGSRRDDADKLPPVDKVVCVLDVMFKVAAGEPHRYPTAVRVQNKIPSVP